MIFLSVSMWGLILAAVIGLAGMTAWAVVGAFIHYGFLVGAPCAAVAAGLWAQLIFWFNEYGP